MKKILLLATYPTQPTGYSKIACKLANHLCKSYDLYYFGYHNVASTKVERDVDDRVKLIDVLDIERELGYNDTYGDNIIGEYIENIKPDIVLIYNDILVVCRMFNAINKLKSDKFKSTFKTVVYLDLVYEYERNEFLTFMEVNSDLILTFSEFWKNHLVTDLNMNGNKIKVLRHGFEPVLIRDSQEECREHFGFLPGDFVILNANRNTYRKALDITIKGFLIFLKGNCDEYNNYPPQFKLFLTCDLNTKSGHNILDLIRNICLELKMNYKDVVNNHILQPKSRPLSDKDMYKLYRACDVGVNSAIGEGFGLCNLEHAYLGGRQVLSDVGPARDIYEGDGDVILIKPSTSYHVSNHTDYHNGLVRVCNATRFADAFGSLYISCRARRVNTIRGYIDKEYNWDKILGQLEEYLDRLS